MRFVRLSKMTLFFIVFFFISFDVCASNLIKSEAENLYQYFLFKSNTKSGSLYFQNLNNKGNMIDWNNAQELSFVGNLRIIKNKTSDHNDRANVLYLIRTIKGKLFILAVPTNENTAKDSGSLYAGLVKMLESKMSYHVATKKVIIGEKTILFARFLSPPEVLTFDRIFKISIVLMLFLVMAGMGMTLTFKDFSEIAKKPRGIIIGTICQFIVMPLIAFLIGHFMGYAEAYPFIFIGMILVTATPGGATSNLMTYFGKGDLALSISMTAFATALSLFVTPLVILVLCSNIPDIQMPVKMLILTIFILVLLPLFIGMFIRNQWKNFAEKATPFFSALGIIAVLFIGVGGVFSNLEVFSNISTKFGAPGYLVIFSLTLLGMIAGGIIPKMVSVNNYQARAISMEIGIRNVALGMTIALLIQDQMGDFDSYMFAVSGIFALFMYVAGIIAIFAYRILLPVEIKEEMN